MKKTNPVDAARIELMLSDLRLPAIKSMWAKLAEQSDKEGWPAARFLAALAELEIAIAVVAASSVGESAGPRVVSRAVMAIARRYAANNRSSGPRCTASERPRSSSMTITLSQPGLGASSRMTATGIEVGRVIDVELDKGVLREIDRLRERFKPIGPRSRTLPSNSSRSPPMTSWPLSVREPPSSCLTEAQHEEDQSCRRRAH